MLRSLHTAISGLRSHQVRMDVIGNNIANVNTIAYKQSRAAFNEMLGQRMVGLGRTTGGVGINPASIGLGVGVGSIDQNWAQGSFQYTNIASDLALSGDGFFVVREGQRNLLTRAGNFTFNGQGELVTSGGLNVQGWRFDANTNALVPGSPEDVRIDPEALGEPRFTQNVTVAGNLSTDAEDGATSSISTVVYDEQGRAHTVVIEFTKTGDNAWDYTARYEGTETPPPFADVTGSLAFNVDGTLDAAGSSGIPATLTWDATYETNGSPLNLSLEGLTQYSGSTTAVVRGQDGHSARELLGYSIDASGTLYLNFADGGQQAAFQLALGDVNNPNGLEQLGDNLYALSGGAGDLTIGRAGLEVKTAVISGALEMSNVDLAAEFTEMIVTQRGYQASARVITTSDELLQEVVQLKR